jgi:hypothetical protein
LFCFFFSRVGNMMNNTFEQSREVGI